MIQVHEDCPEALCSGEVTFKVKPKKMCDLILAGQKIPLIIISFF
jgi:hypothetical protein